MSPGCLVRSVAVTTTSPLEAPAAPSVSEDAATRAFSVSMLVSAIRCVLTYVVFPWLLPLLGVAGGIGPSLGLAIAAVAIVSNVVSIRRFWRADHRWKHQITVLNVAVIILVSVLAASDIAALT